MTNNYPFFKRIVHSFYSKEMYRYVGRIELSKIGIKYMFLLLLVFWIPEIVKMQVSLSKSLNDELPKFVDKLPNITIKNGIASIDRPSPCIVKDDETGKDLMIFDTSGEYTSLEGTEAGLLMTGTKLIYKQNDTETREYSLRTIGDFTLTHDKILAWAGWCNYAWVLCYLFIIPCALLYRMFQVLIYSLIGLIFQAAQRTNLSFQTIYRLGTVAITPAFVIDKIFGYFNIDFPGWSLMCLMISLGYLFFAMQAAKQTDEELLSPPPPEFRTDDGSGNSGI